MSDYRVGPFTPDNNAQDVDAVNTCSCPYCDAKPGHWCLTKSGYIAAEEHVGRLQEYSKRCGGGGPPRPEWVPVTPAKARIVTIEVVLPVDHEVEHGAMLVKALDVLRANDGFAQVVGRVYVEQTMADAGQLLAVRSIDL